MKKKLYLSTALFLLCQATFAQETFHRHTNDHFNSPTVESSAGNSNTGGNINVVYHRCDWTISPNVNKVISGTVTTYFKTTSANVSVITFDFNKTSFNGSLSVTYHGIACGTSFPASGAVDTLTITLPSTIATTGTLDSLSITYSGTPPGVYGQAEGFQRGQDALGNWYIYTLSESYEEKDWWPNKSDMQDKIDSIDINVTVPWTGANTYWVAAPGILMDSAITGVTRTFKYKHRYPIASYLVALGVAKYNRHHRGTVNISGKNVPVVYYTYPDMTGGTLTTALSRMDISKTELVEFSNKYGPYPFANEKHGYYQFGWGGGMEHQTFSAMSGGSMASWSVIAHELGHQWWGDKVSFGTWNHLWLAEGFAQYSEVLAAELIPAIGVNPATHIGNIKTTARSTNTTPVLLSAGSIASSNTIWTVPNDNAVYKRGCMIVSMLRAMMGDNKFFNGCKAYQSDPLLAYKSATTADLQRNLENQMNGVNLTPFFNSWVNGSGTPTYTGNYYISGKTIQFTLTQSRNPGATPFMPMPVIVKIANAGGTIDTTVVIYHYSSTQVGYAGDIYQGMHPAGNGFLTYHLSFTPATVSFDPDNKTMATGTLSGTASPLDINILSFTANKVTIGNQINLSIANNEPITKVILLKSSNGTDFNEAGTMGKTNTSGSVNHYQFNDILPFSTVTFYRAKIYTASKEEYTAIVKVQQSINKDLIISPNPATDVINISFDNTNRDKATVRITNAEGKIVMESATNNDFIHFDVINLSTGVYMVQVMKLGQVSGTNKLVVRR